MKSVICILFISIFSNYVYAQYTEAFYAKWDSTKVDKEFIRTNHPDSIKVDIIDYKKVFLRGLNIFDIKSIPILDVKKIYKTLKKTKEYISEICECWVLLVTHNGTEIRFENIDDKNPKNYYFSQLESLGKDTLIINKKKYFIGQSCDILFKSFPKSFVEYKKTGEFYIKTYNFNEMTIAIWDIYFVIKNGKITSIGSRAE
jgi:hypothetical protein